jgi:uncharacterized protein YecT (DUF1311 family)
MGQAKAISVNTLVVAIIVSVVSASQATAQIAVTEEHIAKDTGRFHADIRYPQTGIPSVDKILNRGEWAKVRESDLEGATAERPYSTGVVYKITRNDAAMLTVEISASVYTGGAHGMPYFDGYAFLAPDYTRVYLAELVDGPRGMKKISDLAVADILKQYRDKNITVTPDFLHGIQSGASPEALEYVVFQWQLEELILEFGPYQIDGYANNPTVHIPMSAIADIVRKDPRQASPSFDCGEAHTHIEHAICSDINLARLDRQVATRFRIALSGRQYSVSLDKSGSQDAWHEKRIADDTTALDKFVAAQKDWLNERNTTCVTAAVACLTASYEKRLRAGIH